MPYKYTCERCGNEFTRRTKAKPNRFCSVTCRHAPEPLIFQDDHTALVPVGHGKYALIDAVDAYWVEGYRWHLNPHGYAVRNPKQSDSRTNRNSIFLHREVMGAKESDDFVVDHIDRDVLNNRRSNLRRASQYQNVHNSRMNSRNTSGFRGVTRTGDGKRWFARISVKGKTTHLGRFDSPEGAAKAYDVAAVEFLGPFATVNFPQEHEN